MVGRFSSLQSNTSEITDSLTPMCSDLTGSTENTSDCSFTYVIFSLCFRQRI
jgi:hypothetical protein